MNFAVVKSSDLARTGRWDAKFHIALAQNKLMVEKLLSLPPDSFERLFVLAPEHRIALEAVAKGKMLHGNARKEYIKTSTREERAVYIAMALKDIAEMERQAEAIELQAKNLRARKAEIESLI